MRRRCVTALAGAGLALVLLATPAMARQVVALVDDAAARPETLAAGDLNRLLLRGIEPGDRVHISLATPTYERAPESLVTLVSFRAHARPAIRNAQLLAAARALARWRDSEASHEPAADPGPLAPLVLRVLQESVRPATPLRLILAGRLTTDAPPDGAALRAALPSESTVTAVDLTPPDLTEDASGDDDAERAEAVTLEHWRAAFGAAGARWQPPPPALR